VSIHSGRSFQELETVQKSQQFIEFLFIRLNTLKFLEHGKTNFFIKNINFPPILLHLGLLLPRANAPFLPAKPAQTLMDGQR